MIKKAIFFFILSLVLNNSNCRLIERLEFESDFIDLEENIDHASYVLFTRDDC